MGLLDAADLYSEVVVAGHSDGDKGLIHSGAEQRYCSRRSCVNASQHVGMRGAGLKWRCEGKEQWRTAYGEEDARLIEPIEAERCQL